MNTKTAADVTDNLAGQSLAERERDKGGCKKRLFANAGNKKTCKHRETQMSSSLQKGPKGRHSQANAHKCEQPHNQRVTPRLSPPPYPRQPTLPCLQHTCSFGWRVDTTQARWPRPFRNFLHTSAPSCPQANLAGND